MRGEEIKIRIRLSIIAILRKVMSVYVGISVGLGRAERGKKAKKSKK